MQAIRIPVHFGLLLAVSVLLVLLASLTPRLIDPFAYSTFALSGGLHALAIVGALRERGRLLARGAFVVAAALLSCLTPWAGIWGSNYAGSYSFVALIGLTSAAGAICYALLTKAFWIRGIGSITLLVTTSACVCVSVGGLWLAGKSPYLQLVLIIGWWLAFSTSLLVSVRAHSNDKRVPAIAG